MSGQLIEQRLNLRFNKTLDGCLHAGPVLCQGKAQSLPDVSRKPVSEFDLVANTPFLFAAQRWARQRLLWFCLFDELGHGEEKRLFVVGFWVKVDPVVLRFKTRLGVEPTGIPELLSGEFGVQRGQLVLGVVVDSPIDDPLHSADERVHDLVRRVALKTGCHEKR